MGNFDVPKVWWGGQYRLVGGGQLPPLAPMVATALPYGHLQPRVACHFCETIISFERLDKFKNGYIKRRSLVCTYEILIYYQFSCQIQLESSGSVTVGSMDCYVRPAFGSTVINLVLELNAI